MDARLGRRHRALLNPKPDRFIMRINHLEIFAIKLTVLVFVILCLFEDVGDRRTHSSVATPAQRRRWRITSLPMTSLFRFVKDLI